MSEQTLQHQDASDQLSDILLVLDKDKKKIQAVKGVDENGELQTVDPTKENQSQFMRVDKHGDIFTNFFTNFWRQLKNPTNFSFFKVPASVAVPAAEEIQRLVDNPTKEGQQLLQQQEVKVEPEKINKNAEGTAPTTQQAGGYRYKAEEIDWETMSHLGLNRETLEKKNLLDPLLKGYKTNELLPISVNLGTAIIRTEARLSLQRNDEGAVRVAIYGVRKEPNLNSPFFGHEFTKEDKDNLLQTGNMGRVVSLTHHGETIPSIISIDRLTNQVVSLRVDKISIPNEIKGVKLDDQQKQALMEGKLLHLEGMISTKGKPFDATVQFNADKCYVEFLFDRANNNRQVQSNAQGHEAPRTFRGVKLDDSQYDKYKEGQYVFIDGLVDKKGNSYQGYVRFNKETGKPDFAFQNPDKLKEQAQPGEAYKTQVAVNSDGKTHEATKNIQEPLKPGQQQPDSKQQQQMQQEPEAPVISKGIKRA